MVLDLDLRLLGRLFLRDRLVGKRAQRWSQKLVRVFLGLDFARSLLELRLDLVEEIFLRLRVVSRLHVRAFQQSVLKRVLRQGQWLSHDPRSR